MNNIILAVSDKEVENVFEKLWDGAVYLLNAFVSAISSTPPKVLGWTLVILFIVWLWKKLT
jgi:hypothetical protein